MQSEKAVCVWWWWWWECSSMVEVLPMYAAQVQSLVLTAFKREVATVLFSLRHNLWKKDLRVSVRWGDERSGVWGLTLHLTLGLFQVTCYFLIRRTLQFPDGCTV